MYKGVFCIIIFAIFLWDTERCRKNPEKCKDGFMTAQGWTRSLFAIKYIGRAKEAREAIVTDQNLRKKHLIQSYVTAAFFFIIGIAFLLGYLR